MGATRENGDGGSIGYEATWQKFYNAALAAGQNPAQAAASADGETEAEMHMTGISTIAPGQTIDPAWALEQENQLRRDIEQLTGVDPGPGVTMADYMAAAKSVGDAGKANDYTAAGIDPNDPYAVWKYEQERKEKATTFQAPPTQNMVDTWTPTTAAPGVMQGLDLTQQGTAEQWYPQNAANLAQPSASTNYYNWAMTPQGGSGGGTNSMSWAPPTQQPAGNFNAAPAQPGVRSTSWQPNTAPASLRNQLTSGTPNTAAGIQAGAQAQAQHQYGGTGGAGTTSGFGTYNQGGRLSSDTASADFYDNNRQRYMSSPTTGAVNTAMQGMGKAGFGEGFAQRAVSSYEKSGTPEMSDYTGANMNALKSEMPDIASEPGFGAYYDRAKERTATSLNKELGARGAYGSSVALGQLSDAFGGLDAERANREADYNLSRLGEQRAWVTERGDSAADADLASARRSGEERDWLSGLSGIALQGDELRNQRNRDLADTGLGYDAADLNRLNSARDAAETVDQADLMRLSTGGNLAHMSAQDDLARQGLSFQSAVAAQNAQRTRGQDYFGNQMSFGNALSGVMGANYADMFGADQELLDKEIAAELGLSAEALSQDYRGQESETRRRQEEWDRMADVAAMWKAAGG